MDSHSGFTPVRRRDIHQQQASPTASGQVPWTATRCNRLLRQLSSRINPLRKQKEACIDQRNALPLDNSSQSLSSSCQNTDAILPSVATYLANHEELGKGDDPDWVPEDRPRKRLKRTYSSKSSSQNSKQAEVDCSIGMSQPREVKIQIPLARLPDQFHNPSSLHPAEGIVFLGVPQEKAYHNEDWTPIKGVYQGKRRQSSIRESFRKMAKSISPSEWMLICGLYNGLDALLKATSRASTPTRLGARSLFASCIQKIPEYMMEEQKLAEDANPDYDGDVASLIYEDLESNGSSETGGWRSLREVVRAHGTCILGNAIEDGSIRPSIARGLVIICLRASANDEAQHLVERLIRAAQPLSKPRSLSERLFSDHGTICLSTLKDYSYRSGRHNFLYRQLANVFSTGLVPIEWIASHDMIDCWNQVIGHIVQDDSHAKDAELLLRTAVMVAHSGPRTSINDEIHAYRLSVNFVGKPGLDKTRSECSISTLSDSPDKPRSTHPDEIESTAVTSTLTNLITVLLSIDLVSNVSSLKEVDVSSIGSTILRNLVLEANHCYQLTGYSTNSTLNNGDRPARLSIPLFAYGIDKIMSKVSKAGDTDMDTGWLEIIHDLNGQAPTLHVLSSFSCSLAHCCGQAGPKEGFDYLQEIFGHLFDLSKSRDYSTAARGYIHRVAIDAAFEFAEGTKKRRHLDWVLELEESNEGDLSKSMLQTPKRIPAKVSLKPTTGFRWEDGICEWVARTPAVVIPKFRRKGDFGKVKTSVDDERTASMECEIAADKQVCLEFLSADVRSEAGRAIQGNVGRPRGRPPKFPDLHSTAKAAKTGTYNPPESVLSDENNGLHPRMCKEPIRVLQLLEDADELSGPESFQEATSPRPVLEELHNGKSARYNARRSTGSCTQKSSQRRSYPMNTRMRRSWAGARRGDSEDELGH
ncbi:hypothetical protein MMC14_005446 [Varicellaria rhodocarpa]|nr:hypothetical protein [Varicellaria rhodocarpa]